MEKGNLECHKSKNVPKTNDYQTKESQQRVRVRGGRDKLMQIPEKVRRKEIVGRVLIPKRVDDREMRMCIKIRRYQCDIKIRNIFY